MRTFVRTQYQAQHSRSTNLSKPRRPISPPVHEVHPILKLQRAIGNQMVQRLLRPHDQDSNPRLACPSCGDEVGEVAQVQTKPVNGSMARWIQRQIGNAEIEDELVKALVAAGAIVQRQVDEPAGGEKDEEEGQTLLAHELTHVMQQSNQPLRIQRKIVVGGKPYTPSPKYYAYLDGNFGAHMKEFVKNMHNDGKPPDFTFTSHEQMGYEVRVRHQITKGIDEAHGGSCAYPDSANPDRLDSTYWDRIGWMHFTPKSPLPAGKEAADAIEAIFAPGADNRLECMAMTVAVEYYSLLKGLGKTRFNALFPGGAGLEISTRLGSGSHPTFYGATKLYKNVSLSSKTEILTGDWVYFKNFTDYLAKHPGGAWQGENAICMGGGKYRGFGVSSLSEADMNAELVRVYNLTLPAADQKTVADLAAEGGGLKLAPVFRPDIAKLAP